MTPLTQLWLPVLLSAVFVFFASSLINMLLMFWHRADYRAFSNDDDVRAAIRNGIHGPGMYQMPFCTAESMKQPDMQEKLKQGPNALVFVRANGMPNMGSYLGMWFVFCLLVSLGCYLIAAPALPAGAAHASVFHMTGLAAFLAYALGTVPNAIWWGHPWSSTIKYVVDGVIYALITAATFAWLWPAA